MATATHHVSVLLSASSGTFNGVMIAAGRSVAGLSRDLDKAQTSGRSMATLFRAGLAAAAITFAVALTGAVRSAIDFEVQMRNVNSISRLTESQLAGISAQVLELSRRVPQSASTLARALYEIASSGFAGAQGFEILEASATAASAGLTSAEVAAKAIVSVINAYGMTAGDAQYVSDVLFKTVELGVLTFEQLASQIGDVIGVASTATVSIEELGAGMAVMTLSGISAAESATSLNRLIQKIINPSQALTEVLHKLGYESGVQALEVDTLNVVMEKLRVLSGGNLQVIREWFPEIRATRGALALMAAGGQNAARVFGEMSTAEQIAGATDAAFREQMKATGNQLKLFANDIQATAIQIALRVLPAIQDFLDGLRNVGGDAIPMVKSAIQALRPFWQGMATAVDDIVDHLLDMYETARPIAVAIAAMAAWAVIGFLNTFGRVLGEVTGFLRDHEGAVQLVVLAYTGYLLAKGVSAAVTWGAETARAVKSAVDTVRLQLMYAKDSFAGLRAAMVTVGPTIFLTAALGVVAAAANEFDKARQSARRLIDEITGQVEMNNLEDMQHAVQRLRNAYRDAVDTANEFKGVGDLFREFAGVLTPLENEGLRAAVAVDEYAKAIREANQDMFFFERASEHIATALGLSQGQVVSLANSIELDLASAWRALAADGRITEGELAGLTEQIALARDVAANGTPKTEALADAFGTVADQASTATEQLDAFKTAMDAIIGVHITSFEALTTIEEGFQDLIDGIQGTVDSAGAVVQEARGLDFSELTEAGRENREALSGLASDILAYAEAIARESGSVAAGNEALAARTTALHDLLIAQGLSEEAAADLLTQLGLTPENLETLYQLNGVEEAEIALAELAAQLTNTDGMTATSYVIMDFSEWQAGYDALQGQLLQFANTQPTSTLYVDGRPAQVSLSTLMAGLEMYGNESPEAEALLQYGGAEQGFETLQDWVNWWVSSDPEATTYVESGQARREMDILFLRAGEYDRLSPEATALLEANSATATIQLLQSRLDSMDGRVVRTVIRIDTYDTYHGALPGTRARWGNVFGYDYAYARAGVTPAHIQVGQRIKYAEPETGGEAFIPRLGDRRRSLAILQEAASWYGHQLSPGPMPMANGGIVGPGATPQADSRAIVAAIQALASKVDKMRPVNMPIYGHDYSLAQAVSAARTKLGWAGTSRNDS